MFRSSRHLMSALLVVSLALVAIPRAWTAEDTSDKAHAEAESRLRKDVTYLASDELEGRGVGTKGIDLAAEHIREEFRKLGLKLDHYNGTPYQTFDFGTDAQLGAENSFKMVGPDKKDGTAGETIEFALGKDFNPLAIGRSGRFHLPVVFAGYGISGRNEKYDDFSNVDVKGKAVILLRHEPQQNDPKSAFNGTEPSTHATFQSKLKNAFKHGAEVVIFCTDAEEIRRFVEESQKQWQTALADLVQADREFMKIENPTRDQLETHRKNIEKLAEEVQKRGQAMAAQFDPLAEPSRAGTDSYGCNIPVLFVRREALDKAVTTSLGKSLEELEKEIDNGPTPQSAELTGWRVQGQTDVVVKASPVKNVVAVLEGEGPHADETIVIGAHYDHLGKSDKNIYHGADDNGSGTTTLLEIARTLAGREKKLPRRVVFIAFTAEESGLIGSARYVQDPLFPLDKTVAMLNLDMVGRLKDNKLIIYGVDTAEEFLPWIDAANQRLNFELIKKNGGTGPSDHASFFPHDIPILAFFTGLHPNYHQPSDTADKLNIEGMRRIGEMAAELAVKIAENPERPKFNKSEVPFSFPDESNRPYLGINSESPDSVTLTVVLPKSPADKAGLKVGDVMLKFGDAKLGSLEDLQTSLGERKIGDKVPVVIRRDGKEMELEVTLEGR